MPTAAPHNRATASPTAIIESWVAISFIETAPATVMVAGIDRSTLPGPSVITCIWPMPTITEKAAKENAAVSTWPAPWPPVNTMVASQTSIAPR